MSGLSCCDAWHFSLPRFRAETLHANCPNCACEAVSLRAGGGDPVTDGDVIARVITIPESPNITVDDVLGGKLTALYSSGVSLVRSGVSRDELVTTIRDLVTRPAEPQTLVGAIVVTAHAIRGLQDSQRWFCVYATDEPGKDHHADILGTTPDGETKSARRKIQDKRRYVLRDFMLKHLVHAEEIEDLADALQAQGL